MILEVVEVEQYVPSLVYAASTGRPPEDRRPIARAFVAKAVYNLPTTHILIDLLHTMPSLRMICGFVAKVAKSALFEHSVRLYPNGVSVILFLPSLLYKSVRP